MPARDPNRINNTGGFGGFTPNPSIPYPGGRVNVSDVNDARNALDFESGLTQYFTTPPSPTPTPTPRPTPRPTPTFNDTSGPTVDLGFGERPIFHWPYDGPNKNGYMVESGIDIYPGDDEDIVDLGSGTGDGTTPGGGDKIVELYKGVPGDHGVPVWWDTNNRGSNTFGPNPWWIGFNTSIGQNFHHDFTGPGFDNNYVPGGDIYVNGTLFGQTPGGTDGTTLIDTNENETAQQLYDRLHLGDGRTDPGFSDPGSGMGPGGDTAGGGHDPGADLTYLANSLGPGNHWDYTRGGYVQNDYAGGAQFSSTAADLLEMWDQSRPGNPNRQVAPDSGKDTFSGSAGYIDENGILRKSNETPAGFAFTMSQKPGAPTLRLGDPNSAAQYNAWLMQQPEYKSFMQRMLTGNRPPPGGPPPKFQPGGPPPRGGTGGG